MKILTVVLAMLIAATLIVGCGESETTPEVDVTPDVPPTPEPEQPVVPEPAEPDEPDVPEAPAAPHPGMAVVQASCTSCHGVDKVENASLSRDGWAEQVTNCLGMAASALPADAKGKMLDYLAENFGE